MMFVPIIWFMSLFLVASSKSIAKNAAFPRAHTKKWSSTLSFGKGLTQRLIRESKIKFCSDLEAATLQLTRPSNTAISLSEVDQIADLLNSDYDNPQLLVGLLVKMSRKFVELNAFTKIKALLVLHMVMNDKKLNVTPQNAVAKVLSSLRNEIDVKSGLHFFSTENLDMLSKSAETVQEIKAVELVRVYYAYVFEYLAVKSNNKQGTIETNKKATTGHSKSAESAVDTAQWIRRVLKLMQQGESVESVCKQLSGPLAQQCINCIRSDRIWALDTLKQLYKNNNIAIKSSPSVMKEVEQLLSRLDAAFTPNSVVKQVSPKGMKIETQQSTLQDVPTITEKIVKNKTTVNKQLMKGNLERSTLTSNRKFKNCNAKVKHADTNTLTQEPSSIRSQRLNKDQKTVSNPNVATQKKENTHSKTPSL